MASRENGSVRILNLELPVELCMRYLLSHLLCCILGLAFLIQPLHAVADGFEQRLVDAALERTRHAIRYDGAYHVIEYPGGDVPADTGVCTDVIIRSYRALDVDLQVLVHEDMTSHFDAYPSRRIWGLAAPDRNIDHRRVPNLQTFLARHGERLPVSAKAADYQPGTLVTWMLPRNLPHIGIVTDRVAPGTGNPLVVHNIGAGPVLEDMLFRFEITGRYRFIPEVRSLPEDQLIPEN